ncbi:hypothetical protein Goklo_028994 [Gossypium klotzschianum]|uniref:Uncharacterized protein n=1 Tax=Gossypium klotzschianum TaxID=34286 RepID=A0A7J8W5D7_9ROSI|nr:hypothetical protein [Gossypium klotzschianum]
MPTVQLFQMMPGAYPNPFMYSSPCDANTSTVTILSMWLIIPTPTTRSPTGGTRIPARATTTPAESWTKEESSA